MMATHTTSLSDTRCAECFSAKVIVTFEGHQQYWCFQCCPVATLTLPTPEEGKEGKGHE
jgi:hypothetical protein